MQTPSLQILGQHSTMSATQSSPEPLSESRFQHLLAAVQMPVRIAQYGLGAVQWLFLGHFACAIWFVILIWQQLHPPLWLLAIASVGIAIPTLISGQLYLILQQISGLTDQITTLLSSAKTTALKSQFFQASESSEKTAKPPKRFQFTDLFSLGGQLMEIKSIADELLGLTSLSGSMMLLANPLFLIATGLAIATLPIAVIMAGITALIVIF